MSNVRRQPPAELVAAFNPRGVFRDEAVRHRLAALSRDGGSVLRILPRWQRYTYRVCLGVLVTALSFVTCVSVDEHAAGPAVLRYDGVVTVTASVTGTVADVFAVPGRRVLAGEPILRYATVDAEGELRAKREAYERNLAALLREPRDAGSRQQVASFRHAIETLEARIEAAVVRASQPGLVGDVWVRPGRFVTAGDVLVRIQRDDGTLRVLAMIPGEQRPLVRTGAALHLELSGYRHHYQTVPVASVTDDIVGPREVKRYVGLEVGESLPLAGPVAIVGAVLPSATFLYAGARIRVHDGMHGRALVRLRRQRILSLLIPSLRGLLPEVDQ